MTFPNLDGRPSEYTEDVPQKLVPYLEWCKENKSLPKRAGFALYIGVSKQTLLTWSQKHPQLLDALKQIDIIQESQLIDGSLFNQMNAVIAKLLLTNHGYSDKVQTDNLNTNINTDADKNDDRPLEERLADILNKIKEVRDQ